MVSGRKDPKYPRKESADLFTGGTTITPCSIDCGKRGGGTCNQKEGSYERYEVPRPRPKGSLHRHYGWRRRKTPSAANLKKGKEEVEGEKSLSKQRKKKGKSIWGELYNGEKEHGFRFV